MPHPGQGGACKGILLALVAIRAVAVRMPGELRPEPARGSQALATFGTEPANIRGVRFRQKLDNYFDVQYYAKIEIGGQSLNAILDTGSFEILTFSKNCTSCMQAGVFDDRRSSTFARGGRESPQAYGSGTCQAEDGFDVVSLGPFRAERQGLWMATRCKMPVLSQAQFGAIVGIGPPGQPASDAKRGLARVADEEERYKRSGLPVPDYLEQMRAEYHEDLEDALSKKSILESFGVSGFSACFGRSPGSPAWIVWNDELPSPGQEGLMQVQVVGDAAWSVEVHDIRLIQRTPEAGPRQQQVLGCVGGCRAVIDTGASLFGVSTPIYDAVGRALAEYDCEDFARLPDISFDLGGHALRFPASSYVGRLTGRAGPEAARLLRRQPNQTWPLDSHRRHGKFRSCDLLFMDIGAGGAPGPTLLLGIPFFREYYTTFDLGSGGGGRSISIARADSDCKRSLDVGAQLEYESPAPRTVDASRLRAPSWRW